VRYRQQGRVYTVDSYFPRFRAGYGVVFGPPLRLDEHFGRELSPEEHQGIATRVLERIYELEAEAAKLFRPGI